MLQPIHALRLSVTVLAVSIGVLWLRSFDHDANVNQTASRWTHLGIPTNEGVPDLSNVSVSFSRSTYMGACPSYRVTIRGDGAAAFEGLANVKHLGTVWFRVDRDDLDGLLDLMEQTRFMSFEHRCMWISNDTPHYVLTVSSGGRVHTSEDGTGGWDLSDTAPWPGEKEAHAKLDALYAAVDLVCKIETLIGTEEEQRALSLQGTAK